MGMTRNSRRSSPADRCRTLLPVGVTLAASVEMTYVGAEKTRGRYRVHRGQGQGDERACDHPGPVERRPVSLLRSRE